MSDKRKCRFTIETGPISARSFNAIHSLLQEMAPIVGVQARADIRLESAPIEPAPVSRVIPRDAN